MGCTRIVLQKDGCVRPGDIPTTQKMIFYSQSVNNLDTSLLASTASACTSHIVYQNTETGFTHAITQSLLWGFIDDIYIQGSVYFNKNMMTVEMQGQLRVGRGDMNKNLQHVNELYTCYAEKMTIAYSSPLPCSL